MIKGIIFDFGGVLNKSGNFKDALDKISYKNDEEYRQFMSLTKDSFSKSHLYEVDDFYDHVREWYDVKLSNEEICDFHIEPNFAIIDYLKDLSQDYKILILTAITKGIIQRFQQSVYLDPYVEKIFETCKEHLTKKDPRLVQKVIQHSQLNPEELVYIDDKQKNLDVADKLGVKTILFLQDIDQLKQDFESLKNKQYSNTNS